MKKIIKESVHIIITATVIAFIVNLYHPLGYSLIAKSVLQEKQSIFYISTKEAKFKYDNNIALFIDSRGKYVFDDGHIKNAINIPAYPEDQSIDDLKKMQSRIFGVKEKVIYCDGMSCKSSYTLARNMLQSGYSGSIYILKEGFPDWKRQGFPFQKANQ